MSRRIDLGHEAVVAVLKAIDARDYVSVKKEPVGVTGVLEENPLGQVNATDSESSMRTAVCCGWSGELHVKYDFREAAS